MKRSFDQKNPIFYIHVVHQHIHLFTSKAIRVFRVSCKYLLQLTTAGCVSPRAALGIAYTSFALRLIYLILFLLLVLLSFFAICYLLFAVCLVFNGLFSVFSDFETNNNNCLNLGKISIFNETHSPHKFT